LQYFFLALFTRRWTLLINNVTGSRIIYIENALKNQKYAKRRVISLLSSKF